MKQLLMSIIELFHVTSQSSWASIQKTGVLEPRCGPRSLEMGDIVPAIYLFDGRDAVENACMNWLGEAIEEPLVILHVQVQSHWACQSPGQFEWVAHTPLCLPATLLNVFDEQWQPLSKGLIGGRSDNAPDKGWLLPLDSLDC